MIKPWIFTSVLLAGVFTIAFGDVECARADEGSPASHDDIILKRFPDIQCIGELACENAYKSLTRANDSNWKLLTVSYGGAVSLLKDLTKAECDKIAAELPRVPKGWRMDDSGYMWPDPPANGILNIPQVQSGWMKNVECFQ